MEKSNYMDFADYGDREEQRKQAYLDGLRRYNEKGIPIVIDGKVCDETEWDKIFTVQEDGFYMADYCMEEDPDSGGRPRLRQIRFDKVYHR